MNILIKGMKMPENCFGCSTKVDPDTRRCNIDGHLFEETFSRITSRRDEACPLVPVPEHGRLIDAEKIGLTDFEIIMCNGNYKEALKMLLDKIKTAPTIIPAEETDCHGPQGGPRNDREGGT